MAGHSKWANIQHRKGRQDAKRGKIFTRLIKEITVAAKLGGGEIASNPRLRLAVDKAKAESMPKDNIENAIKRGCGQLDGVNYEEIRYEGYGLNGAAIMIDCLSDNRQRTVADVRHALTKYGGNLGTDGSVAYLFTMCGSILFAPGSQEEKIMEIALETDAEDILNNEDGSVEIITSVANFSATTEALTLAGLQPEVAEITMKPANEVSLVGDNALKMQKLLDALDDIDDVQNVYTNAIIEE